NVVDHRKDLFSTDDRYRDHRRTGAERDLDEPAATEALELVPLAERLADAFVAFGEHADDLAGVEQPGRVFRACKRVAALARDLTDEREPERQVGGEQPAVSAGSLVDRELHHERVQRQRAGVVRDQQSGAARRDVLQPTLLHAPPAIEERPEDGQQHVLGEVGVETEVVDRIRARYASSQECERALEVRLESRRRRRRSPPGRRLVTLAVSGRTCAVPTRTAIRGATAAQLRVGTAAVLDQDD